MDLIELKVNRLYANKKITGFLLKNDKHPEKIKKYLDYIFSHKGYTFEFVADYLLLTKNFSFYDYFIDNFDLIYDMGISSVEEIIKSLFKFSYDKRCNYFDRLVNKSNVDFSLIIDICNYNNDLEFLKYISENWLTKSFDVFESFFINNQTINFVKEHMNEIIKEHNDWLFTCIIHNHLFTSEEMQFIRKSIICDEKYINKIVDKILSKKLSSKDPLEDINTIKYTVKKILKELCENEHVQYSDINFWGAGGYSAVYEIGNKVFKIGTKRESKSFPNNPYIIQPLLRESFDLPYGRFIFLEVTEKVNTNGKFDNEDVYALYKNMRDMGLLWADPKIANIGKLEKDNTVHWNTDLNPTDASLELKDKTNDQILKSGDNVVLDADFIFPATDANLKYYNINDTKIFEERYQEELSERKGR